jgi:hypothetical protein
MSRKEQQRLLACAVAARRDLLVGNQRGAKPRRTTIQVPAPPELTDADVADADVVEIRRRVNDGERLTALAKEFWRRSRDGCRLDWLRSRCHARLR